MSQTLEMHVSELTGRTFVRNPPGARQEEDLRLLGAANGDEKQAQEALDALADKYLGIVSHFRQKIVNLAGERGSVVDVFYDKAINILMGAPSRYDAERGSSYSSFVFNGIRRFAFGAAMGKLGTIEMNVFDSDDDFFGAQNWAEQTSEPQPDYHLETPSSDVTLPDSLNHFLLRLPPLDREIIRIILVSGNEHGINSKIARKLKLSRERIGQITKRGFAQLKELCGGIDPYVLASKQETPVVVPELNFNPWFSYNNQPLKELMAIAQLPPEHRDFVHQRVYSTELPMDTFVQDLSSVEQNKLLKKLAKAKTAYMHSQRLAVLQNSPELCGSLESSVIGIPIEFVQRAFTVLKLGVPGSDVDLRALGPEGIADLLGCSVNSNLYSILSGKEMAALFENDVPFGWLPKELKVDMGQERVLEHCSRHLLARGQYLFSTSGDKAYKSFAMALDITKNLVPKLNEIYLDHIDLTHEERRMFELLISSSRNSPTLVGGEYLTHHTLIRDHTTRFRAAMGACSLLPSEDQLYNEWLDSNLGKGDFIRGAAKTKGISKDTLDVVLPVVSTKVLIQLLRANLDIVVDSITPEDMNSLYHEPITMDRLFPVRLLAYLDGVSEEKYTFSGFQDVFSKEAIKRVVGSRYITDNIFSNSIGRLLQYAGMHTTFVQQKSVTGDKAHDILHSMDYALDSNDALIIVYRNVAWTRLSGMPEINHHFEDHSIAREKYFEYLHLTDNEIFARYMVALALDNDRGNVEGHPGMRISEQFVDSLSDNMYSLYAACGADLTESEIEKVGGRINRWMDGVSIYVSDLEHIATKLREGIKVLVDQDPDDALEPANKGQEYVGVRKVDSEGEVETFEGAVDRLLVQPINERKEFLQELQVEPTDTAYYHVLLMPELRFKRLKQSIVYAQDHYPRDEQIDNLGIVDADELQKAQQLHRNGGKVYSFVSRMSKLGVPVSGDVVELLHAKHYGVDTIPKCLDLLCNEGLIHVSSLRPETNTQMYILAQNS